MRGLWKKIKTNQKISKEARANRTPLNLWEMNEWITPTYNFSILMVCSKVKAGGKFFASNLRVSLSLDAGAMLTVYLYDMCFNRCCTVYDLGWVLFIKKENFFGSMGARRLQHLKQNMMTHAQFWAVILSCHVVHGHYLFRGVNTTHITWIVFS